jgi:type I restriction enzyme M protein
MVEQVNPRLGETVLDPACGTGGFLTCAIAHLRSSSTAPAPTSAPSGSIRGIEKKQLPHLLCTTNLMLHGIEVPSNIRHDNTLGPPWNRLGQARPRGRHRHQSALRRHGGRRHRGQLPAEFRTRETADLFLSLIVNKLLKRPAAAPASCCPTASCSARASRPRSRKTC